MMKSIVEFLQNKHVDQPILFGKFTLTDIIDSDDKNPLKYNGLTIYNTSDTNKNSVLVRIQSNNKCVEPLIKILNEVLTNKNFNTKKFNRIELSIVNEQPNPHAVWATLNYCGQSNKGMFIYDDNTKQCRFTDCDKYKKHTIKDAINIIY